MITVIILSWKRRRNLERIVRNVNLIDKVSQIIIWNNDASNNVDFNAGEKFLVVNPSKDLGMNTRWYAAMMAQNECILTLDDDAIVEERAILKLYDEWEKDQSVIHGYWGRSPTKNDEYAEFSRCREMDVHIIGTKAAMFHRRYALLLLKHIWDFNLTYDTYKNQCEDIYLSYLVMNHSGRLNREHAAPPGSIKELDASQAISNKETHYEERQRVMRRCLGHFWVPGRGHFSPA